MPRLLDRVLLVDGTLEPRLPSVRCQVNPDDPVSPAGVGVALHLDGTVGTDLDLGAVVRLTDLTGHWHVLDSRRLAVVQSVPVDTGVEP